MKSIIIVVVMTVVLGVIGFVATAAIAQHQQNAARAAEQANWLAPVSQDDQMAQSEKKGGEAIDDLRARQSDAYIGAGAGAAVGLLGGLLLAVRIGKKK